MENPQSYFEYKIRNFNEFCIKKKEEIEISLSKAE